MYYRQHRVEATRILTKREIAMVLSQFSPKVGDGPPSNARQNLVIFSLATFCGLRVGEISKLLLRHVRLESSRPHLALPGSITKRSKSRRVPLHWDGKNLESLAGFKSSRVDEGASSSDPFVCVRAAGKRGKVLSVRNIQFRFKRMLRVLGPERAEELSIHSGRHSFCTHALAGGRNLIEVRDAAGHSNVATTSVYLHLANEEEPVGNLFGFV